MSATAPAPTCRRCAAPLEPDQEYCLECGARIVAPRPRERARWIAPSLAALIVAAAGGAIAILGSRGSPARASQAIVATSRLDPAPPPASPPPAAPAHGSKQRLVTWPGTGGYTLVLATVPLGDGVQRAKREALAALGHGLPDVGVLVSTSYASLHPGYYVVFSGIYASREEAQADLLAARRYFPSAYASPVVR